MKKFKTLPSLKKKNNLRRLNLQDPVNTVLFLAARRSPIILNFFMRKYSNADYRQEENAPLFSWSAYIISKSSSFSHFRSAKSVWATLKGSVDNFSSSKIGKCSARYTHVHEREKSRQHRFPWISVSNANQLINWLEILFGQLPHAFQGGAKYCPLNRESLVYKIKQGQLPGGSIPIMTRSLGMKDMATILLRARTWNWNSIKGDQSPL